MKDKLKEQFINKLCNEYNMEVINEEQFCDFIDQNFIGREVIKKIELMRYIEEIKEMRGTEYANGWSDAVDKLLELIKKP